MPTDSSLRGKTCLVTGAAGGIGFETALGLARQGATVLLVARDRDAGAAAAMRIGELAPQGAAEVFVADLSRQRAVEELADRVRERHTRLDVLVNNAAAVHAVRRVTDDGFETTLATNHLAPFLLTRLLASPLKNAGAARVVNVSSYLHTMVKAIPWDDLQSERSYDSHRAYNLTKLMNVLFTYELARRWADTTTTVNCLHPGWPLRTNLGREERGAARAFDQVSKFFAAPADRGARTSIFSRELARRGRSERRVLHELQARDVVEALARRVGIRATMARKHGGVRAHVVMCSRFDALE